MRHRKTIRILIRHPFYGPLAIATAALAALIVIALWQYIVAALGLSILACCTMAVFASGDVLARANGQKPNSSAPPKFVRPVWGQPVKTPQSKEAGHEI